MAPICHYVHGSLFVRRDGSIDICSRRQRPLSISDLDLVHAWRSRERKDIHHAHRSGEWCAVCPAGCVEMRSPQEAKTSSLLSPAQLQIEAPEALSKIPAEWRPRLDDVRLRIDGDPSPWVEAVRQAKLEASTRLSIDWFGWKSFLGCRLPKSETLTFWTTRESLPSPRAIEWLQGQTDELHFGHQWKGGAFRPILAMARMSRRTTGTWSVEPAVRLSEIPLGRRCRLQAVLIRSSSIAPWNAANRRRWETESFMRFFPDGQEAVRTHNVLDFGALGSRIRTSLKLPWLRGRAHPW